MVRQKALWWANGNLLQEDYANTLHLPGLLLPGHLSLRQAAVNPRLFRRPSDAAGRSAQSLVGSLLPALGPGARNVLYGLLLINSSAYGDGLVKLNAACKTLKTVIDTWKDCGQGWLCYLHR